MDVSISERVNGPVSSAELERRWSAARDAMESAGVDVLLIQNRTYQAGGYVRWFIDHPAPFVPVTVVVPRDEPMTVVMHGDLDGDRAVPPGGDGILRGVGRVLTTPSFPSVAYTSEYDAELALRALAPWAAATIGLLSPGQMSLAAGERLQRELPRATFVDATGLIDPIKAVKSDEEQRLIRATARLQDEVMAEAIDAVRPGNRESDVVAVARRAAYERGSEAGVYMTACGPVGEPSQLALSHLQHRRMREGDVLALLVEVDGPGGLYTELGRTIVLGEAPSELKEEHEFALAAQRFTVEQLLPGASPGDIWESYNEFLRENGRPLERRLHAHGQGADLVERPLIRHDETLPLAAGMNMACHPSYHRNGVMAWICDNWIIGADGPGARLHEFPQEMVER